MNIWLLMTRSISISTVRKKSPCGQEELDVREALLFPPGHSFRIPSQYYQKQLRVNYWQFHVYWPHCRSKPIFISEIIHTFFESRICPVFAPFCFRPKNNDLDSFTNDSQPLSASKMEAKADADFKDCRYLLKKPSAQDMIDPRCITAESPAARESLLSRALCMQTKMLSFESTVPGILHRRVISSFFL